MKTLGIKKLFLIVICIVLAAGVMGCSNQQVLAKACSEDITAEQFVEQLNQKLVYNGVNYETLDSYYVNYYGNEEAGLKAAAQYKDDFLRELVVNKLITGKAKDLGLDELNGSKSRRTGSGRSAHHIP